MAIKRTGDGQIDDVAHVPDQNHAEVWNDPREGDPISGNRSAYTLRTIYDYWNAAYRGLVPHGVLSKVPNSPDVVDNPATFEESDADFEADNTEDTYTEPNIDDITAVPVVIVDNLENLGNRAGEYFTSYLSSVSTSVDRIAYQDMSRVQLRIKNNGPGILYIGENESRGYIGYPVAVGDVLILATTRDVWAVQQTGQTGPCQVGIIASYQKRERP